jgi:hypothetical protein
LLRSFAEHREFVRPVGSYLLRESVPFPENCAPAPSAIIGSERISRGASARDLPHFDAGPAGGPSRITNLDCRISILE